MTRIPVFRWVGRIAQYWPRKGDWRDGRPPQDSAFIRFGDHTDTQNDNVATERAIAAFLLRTDPKAKHFYFVNTQRLISVAELRQAAGSDRPFAEVGTPHEVEPQPPTPPPTPPRPPADPTVDRVLDAFKTLQTLVNRTPSLADAAESLGIQPTDDWETIRRAYRRRARETHPDRGGSPAEFAALHDAYLRLKALRIQGWGDDRV